ncbi:hypothetical protein QBC46DRAFT_385771 [Diplogelasinospora grovesii]|uniref:DUF4238 domain-containing protein n=1 Tax=Diplogelasinospora grovesii TaxID=303347 RepID=A0AAN6N6Z7_9PEZI|nr:hypothetical protein QBC46DRAFT_385771 [Diplogelasinospora grovesii]
MATTATPQYQHFVPQFLLKNFSHRFGKKPKGYKYQKGMYPTDIVTRCVDLSADPAVICEKPVKRILGQMNMYHDTSQPAANQQHVEKMLSKFESDAKKVFDSITQAFEQKQPNVKLTRDKRDLIRKFLFIMLYRSSGFYERFYHDRAEDYDANDRALLCEYMNDKGYQRPVDVWFDNLRAIIELDMDPERGNWTRDIVKRMFTEDAMWFIGHTGLYYMAICTPANPQDEFILTDNSYGVFEGPNHFAKDGQAAKTEGSVHTPLHYFAPVSPKLMIVLRCSMLPLPSEDANPEVKARRETMRLAVFNDYVYEVKSLLADLPVAKADNNYTEIIDGRLYMKPGEDGRQRREHEFSFPIFPIETRHVDTINGILLDNAYRCSSVVFESDASFARTLEWYLTTPPSSIGKVVMNDPEAREACLKKLESISRYLGSTKRSVWVKKPVPVIPGHGKSLDKHTEYRRFMKKIILAEDNHALLEALKEMAGPDFNMCTSVYDVLDSSAETWDVDIDQAWRMWDLRVKLDDWSKGVVDESIRQRNRELLVAAYLRLPPRRVLLYIKFNKQIILGNSFGRRKDYEAVSREDLAGPEDSIARARQVIRPEKLTTLMHTAAMTDLQLKRQPGIADLWAPPELNMGGVARLIMSNYLAFQHAGYIRDCGIDEVEQLARKVQVDIVKNRRHQESRGGLLAMLSEDERIEVLTRVQIRQKFAEILGDKLGRVTVEALKEAVFGFAYPTPNPPV